MPPPAAPSSRLSLAAWCALFAVVAATLQLIQPVPYDADTGYHVAVARLLREHGILHAFPWTPWSWLADHYADKELVFHLLIAPFTVLDPNTAARITGTVIGTLLLGTIFGIVRAEGVRLPGVWTLVTLACSGGFLVRFALVRPHVLAIVLTLWITWAVSRRRLPHIAVAAFLFPLSYIAWHQALFLTVVVETAYLLSGRRPSFRAAATACGALAAGVLVHPNFPDTLRYLWLVNVDILFNGAWAGRAGFEMGGEFRPLSPLGAIRLLLLPTILCVGALAVAWRHRKQDPVPLAFALAALAYLAVTLRTQRFLEYFVPFATVAAGLASKEIKNVRAAPVTLGVAAAYTALVGLGPIAKFFTRSDLFPAAVTRALDEAIPRGKRVFTCDWEFTGEMMLALPDRIFMIAVDPVLFWRKDPDRYNLWFAMTRDPPERPAAKVRDAFGARYVLCDVRPKWARFVAALDQDPEARRVGQIGLWNVFEVPPREPE